MDLVTNLPKSESKSISSKSGLKSGLEYDKPVFPCSVNVARTDDGVVIFVVHVQWKCVSEAGQYEGEPDEVRERQSAGQQVQKPTRQHPAL